MSAFSSPRRAGALVVTLLAMVAGAFLAPRAVASAGPPLSISVVGNHFVNGAGQTIRLLGVNREGTEYACVNGTGYAVGPEDASDAAAIAAWHANAVRIPINEDCWLGINGLPAYGTTDGYRQAIESYVAALNADGIYAILDLQWNAPGSLPSEALRSMPDEHSLPFWTSVASTFAGNPAVLFDAFNEPHSVSWPCWRNGGCSVPATPDGTPPDPSQTYTAVGMQAIVDTIRATGARQPILVAGLDHGNDLSGWLANMPSDPIGQLGASVHDYQSDTCITTACWDAVVAPVAATVPTTTIEFSESDCAQTWDNTIMNWDDAHGIGYLGWGWFIMTAHCQYAYLITAWNGTPAAPNGTALQAHLAALAAANDGSATPSVASVAPGSPVAQPTTGASVTGAGQPTAGPAAPCVRPTLRVGRTRLTRHALSVGLRSSRRAAGRLRARTVARYGRRSIALGSKRFRLPAGSWRVITVALPARARRLLAGHRWVRAAVAVTVAGDHPAGASCAATASARRVWSSSL